MSSIHNITGSCQRPQHRREQGRRAVGEDTALLGLLLWPDRDRQRSAWTSEHRWPTFLDSLHMWLWWKAESDLWLMHCWTLTLEYTNLNKLFLGKYLRTSDSLMCNELLIFCVKKQTRIDLGVVWFRPTDQVDLEPIERFQHGFNHYRT